MPSSQYSFTTRWRMTGDSAEVYRTIEDTTEFVRWWPAVWLKVDVLDPGDEQGHGRVVALVTKGWLPYVLRWQARTVAKTFPQRIVLQASGDFDGEGRWTFCPTGSEVDIEYLWTIRADKPLLRYLSFVLRPAFEANHRWAMERGEESLRLELARRRARSADERARVPAPPPAVFLGPRSRRRLQLADVPAP